jgi:hypothetical protein
MQPTLKGAAAMFWENTRRPLCGDFPAKPPSTLARFLQVFFATGGVIVQVRAVWIKSIILSLILPY